MGKLSRVLLVILALVGSASHAAASPALEISPRGEETEIALGLPGIDAVAAWIESAPTRLEIEVAGPPFAPSLADVRLFGLVKSVHSERLAGRPIHLIVDLTRPAVISAVRTIPAAPGSPSRTIVLLAPTDDIAMRRAAGVVYRPGRPGETVKGDSAKVAAAKEMEPPGPHILMLPRAPAASAPSEESKPEVASPPAFKAVTVREPAPPGKPGSIESIIRPRRTIVIDPGHGGIDPGADSVSGYHEKEVTLATALALRRVLEATGRYKVVLTRSDDVYLKLRERVTGARAAHGDLFISLHADSAGLDSDKSTRGASIYTLSQTASDAESELYAQRENRADAIGGVDLGDKSDDVAGILVDLTVRETVNEGNRLAGMLEAALAQGGVALLPRAPRRAAGFAVLKAPDIPSVLIEMGYLSDSAEARELASPAHQLKFAKAITAGIDRYFSWLAVSRL
jgi:N-acetylmuramoyl-L-alanine amidase